MKLRTTYIIFTVLVGMAINACSTKKDTVINRNWHALNTKYNTLYNGNIAFEEGREELNANYRDDYWEILPVERLEVTDEIKLAMTGLLEPTLEEVFQGHGSVAAQPAVALGGDVQRDDVVSG